MKASWQHTWPGRGTHIDSIIRFGCHQRYCERKRFSRPWPSGLFWGIIACLVRISSRWKKFAVLCTPRPIQSLQYSQAFLDFILHSHGKSESDCWCCWRCAASFVLMIYQCWMGRLLFSKQFCELWTVLCTDDGCTIHPVLVVTTACPYTCNTDDLNLCNCG